MKSELLNDLFNFIEIKDYKNKSFRKLFGDKNDEIWKTRKKSENYITEIQEEI